MLEKQSTFTTGEEFDLVLTASSSNLGACISDMEMKVEGINGVISGETGTASIKGIAVSFQEEDKENTILLPVGGCDMNSHQSVRHQKLEDDCSILPNIVDESAASKGRLVLFTTRGADNLWDFKFRPDDRLLFGRESAGVPDEVHDQADARVIIPIRPETRSLNVVVSAGIALAEAQRQLR